MKYFQIEKLIAEISPAIEGARFQKIIHPDPYTLQFGIFGETGRHYLTLCLRNNLSCFYLTDEKISSSDESRGGVHLQLRGMIDGGRIVSLSQVQNDRVVIFEIETKSAEDKIFPYRMVWELFTHGPCFYLLDRNQNIVVVFNPSARRLPRSQQVGTRYLPPPAPGIIDCNQLEDELELIDIEGGYNDKVTNYFSGMIGSESIDEKRREISRPLKASFKKLVKEKKSHEQLLKSAKEADWYRQCGELLSANYSAVRKGVKTVKLPDLYSKNPTRIREIPLDPKLHPSANVEKYFKKYKKLKKGEEYARERLAIIERELVRLHDFLSRLEEAGDIAGLAKISAEIPPRLITEKQKPAQQSAGEGKRLPYRKFTSVDGFAILVGRGSKDNDELTFKVARGRDLWLHASAARGSHVVVPLKKEAEFTDQTLLDAAHLAAFFSDFKTADSADIDYTYRKNVSRLLGKAHKPGLVLMSDRKTIHLRIDSQRLKRILDTGRQP